MDEDKLPNMNGSTAQITGNEVYWPSDTTTNSNTSIEIQLKKKDEQPHRKIVVGLNIEYECKNS